MHKPIALAALTIVAALTAAPAGARPHGVNGLIAYDRLDPASPGDTFVFTANPDGSHQQQLVASHTCCAAWSPDGRRLAIPRATDDGRIGSATVSADGSGYVALPLDDPTLNIGCGTGAWSPDGTRLTCESWDDASPGRDGLYTISPRDGNVLARVTANPLGGHDVTGSYSPDGRRIAFTRFDGNGDSAGLFTVRTDGRGLRQITPDGMLLNIGADWAPRGATIIFSRHVTPDARGSLWLVQANGSDLHELRIHGLGCGGPIADPEGFGCHGPRWSPDGTRLVFAGNSSATGSNLYTANADGSNLEQITTDGDDDNPDWGTHPLTP